ncbi:hypothetical protein [Demequina muriae]|uniref:Cell division protein FtsL n=1 Tax=Demequina muriae TaxID=3051664 RepID=A0ABT8GDL9_9MICO|nr:hypothetical protein [Demequina sp. EGI L300058]MDN4479525.1 hypothetical protein [Demequina sp. EGI L300058]
MSAAPLRRVQDAPSRPGVPGQTRSSAAARAATARTAPASRPTSDQRPRLRAVGAPEQARSLAPFAWACILIILSALAAVLLLNTSMAKGAYERRDLKIEIASLHQERSALVTALEANSAPNLLADAATDLGMRPHDTLRSVSLETGAVLEPGAG